MTNILVHVYDSAGRLVQAFVYRADRTPAYLSARVIKVEEDDDLN